MPSFITRALILLRSTGGTLGPIPRAQILKRKAQAKYIYLLFQSGLPQSVYKDEHPWLLVFSRQGGSSICRGVSALCFCVPSLTVFASSLCSPSRFHVVAFQSYLALCPALFPAYLFLNWKRQLAPTSHPLSVRESVANSNLFATLSLTLKGWDMGASCRNSLTKTISARPKP